MKKTIDTLRVLVTLSKKMQTKVKELQLRKKLIQKEDFRQKKITIKVNKKVWIKVKITY